MMGHDTILDQILARVRAEIAAAKAARPPGALTAMLAGAPPVRDFELALTAGFGVIAEIKACSPSRGAMRAENVRAAPQAYEHSPVVRAVSVLTNRSDFGMSIERLRDVRAAISKPVLRKEFIIDPYQVVEARAFGADAILLMTQRLDADELRRLHDQARELGMAVLVECRTAEEIARVPPGARIVGINSRDMLSSSDTYSRSRSGPADLSTNLDQFESVHLLPPGVLKIAESGISPASIARVRALGYDAALIGTDLLLHPEGPAAALRAYEAALREPRAATRA